jgi:hypothetical protein
MMNSFQRSVSFQLAAVHPGLRALDGRKVGPGGWAEGGADDGRARHGDGDKEEAVKPKVPKDDTKRLKKVESDAFQSVECGMRNAMPRHLPHWNV